MSIINNYSSAVNEPTEAGTIAPVEKDVKQPIKEIPDPEKVLISFKEKMAVLNFLERSGFIPKAGLDDAKYVQAQLAEAIKDLEEFLNV